LSDQPGRLLGHDEPRASGSTTTSPTTLAPTAWRRSTASLVSRRSWSPANNADEATLIPGLKVLAVSSLPELVAHLRGDRTIAPHVRGPGESVAELGALNLRRCRPLHRDDDRRGGRLGLRAPSRSSGSSGKDR